MTTTTQRVYTALDRALTGPATDPRRIGTAEDRLAYMTDAVVAALDIPPFENILVDGPEIPAALQDTASGFIAAIEAEFKHVNTARYMEARVGIIADMSVTPPKITGIIIRDIQYASIPPQRKK